MLTNHGSSSDGVIEAAATVILLRDGHADLEVFLMRRAAEASAYGGAYVFPGGKVDPADRAVDVSMLDRTTDDLHLALGEKALTPTDAMAIHVAAVRELFEESGVLLATDVSGSSQLVLQSSSSLGCAFYQVVDAGGFRFATHAIAPWSRWITPIIPGVKRRRFDTRFFVALMPSGQTAKVSDSESTLGCWLTPSKALTLYWQRDIDLAPPQIHTLSQLTRHRGARDAFEAARIRLPPLIEPLYLIHEGHRMICYPGDVAHSVRETAFLNMPRLIYCDGRFEPVGGLEALLT